MENNEKGVWGLHLKYRWMQRGLFFTSFNLIKHLTLKRNMNLEARRTGFRNALPLRQCMTIPEQMLWERLKDRQVMGIRFRRQHAVRRYILDFYAHEIKLEIELDGAHHKENATRFYDADRTEILASWGITIIRFDNEQVRMNLDGVIESIESKIRLLRNIR